MNKRALSFISAFIFLTACSRNPEIPRGLENSDLDAVARQQDDVCALLTNEEVEIALNSPLEGKAPKPRAILVGMTMCDLSTGNQNSSASWGVLASGASRFRSYGSWNEGYLERIRGVGDEAFWDQKLDTLIVRNSNLAFGVRLSVKNPPASGEEQRRTYTKETARRLAAKILRRL